MENGTKTKLKESTEAAQTLVKMNAVQNLNRQEDEKKKTPGATSVHMIGNMSGFKQSLPGRDLELRRVYLWKVCPNWEQTGTFIVF